MPLLDLAFALLMAVSGIHALQFRRRTPAALPTAVLCVSAALWALSSAWWASEPEDPRVVAMMLFAASLAAVSAFVVVSTLVSSTWRMPWWLIISMVVEMAFTTVGSLTRLWLSEGESFRTGPVFIIHSAYCFGLMLAAILTLHTRRSDHAWHIRMYVIVIPAVMGILIALQVGASGGMHYVVAAGAIVTVWTLHHHHEWNAMPSDRAALVDDIGAFLFVFDREGRLLDWNGPAGALLSVADGCERVVGAKASDLFHAEIPFADGARIEFSIDGGILVTTGHVHRVEPSPRSSGHRWVVMLRTLTSQVQPESWPIFAGDLEGHDPATQTLSRAAMLNLLRRVGAAGGRAVRLDVDPGRAASDPDEVMYVVARRIEARHPDLKLGRVDTLSIAVTSEDPQELRAFVDGLEDDDRTALAADLGVVIRTRLMDSSAMSPEAFAEAVGRRRPTQSGRARST